MKLLAVSATVRIITTLVIGFTLVALTASCGSNPTATTTTPSAVTSPLTEIWSTNFGPKGSAARQFTAAKEGTVTITLASLTPPLDNVGVGIGTPSTTGDGGCTLSQAVDSVPSTDPLITTTVAAGVFCVKIYDKGLATFNETFSITVVHP